jgi:Domain of unknown function (DUF397)
MERRPVADFEWIKASYSSNLGACVEIAPQADMILLRDSKRPDVMLRFTQLEIFAFIDGAKRGEFDHLVGR